MPTLSYPQRRGEIEHYFDRTALDAWEKLTSDAPVSGIRATVRAGRDRMRARLSSWLPEDLTGRRVLDAGCGTGALAAELAARGADVLAIDLSPSLIEIAESRLDAANLAGAIDFRAGDMLDADLGTFDHVVAMDSLIHYTLADVAAALETLAPRVRGSMVFTFAPRTRLLAVMHAAGRLFPRGDRAPSIEPVSERALEERLGVGTAFADWKWAATERVSEGFYTSQAVRFVRSAGEVSAS